VPGDTEPFLRGDGADEAVNVVSGEEETSKLISADGGGDCRGGILHVVEHGGVLIEIVVVPPQIADPVREQQSTGSSGRTGFAMGKVFHKPLSCRTPLEPVMPMRSVPVSVIYLLVPWSSAIGRPRPAPGCGKEPSVPPS
jgi:hypothetical protein